MIYGIKLCLLRCFAKVNRRARLCVICMLLLFVFDMIVAGIIVVAVTASKERGRSCVHTFQNTPSRSVGSNSRPYSAVVADLNNDTLLDIVVANFGTNDVGIFLGYSNGVFQPQVAYSTGPQSQPYCVVVADFNNDKILDVVVGNHGTNSLGILVAHENTTFPIVRPHPLGHSKPTSIAADDLNNDKNIDIVVANYDTSTVIVLFGDGNAYFVNETTYFIGYDSTPSSIVVANLNQDNYKDIVVANSGTFNIVIYLGQANGAFVLHKMYSTGINSQPSSVAVGDFNNDQRLDIVVSNYGTSSIGVFLANANGTYGKLRTLYIGSDVSPNSVVVGDFNHDNKSDVAVSSSGNDNVIILAGFGNGSFSIYTKYSTTLDSGPVALMKGDFNYDRKLDLATVNKDSNAIEIYLRYVRKLFSGPTVYLTGIQSSPTSVAIGDLNNDNVSDIVVSNSQSNNIVTFLGSDSGLFQMVYSSSQNESATEPVALVLSDVNDDDWLDAIVTFRSTDNVGIYLGLGNGNFSEPLMLQAGDGSSPDFVVVADFNNDNKPDFVIIDMAAPGVGVYLGYGDGNFAPQVTFSITDESTPSAIAVGYINNDHVLDIVAASVGEGLVMLFGSGDGTFQVANTLLVGSNPLITWISVTDLNIDSFQDIVFVDYDNNTLSIFYGSGNGTFVNGTTYSTGDGSQPSSFVIEDFNNDNTLDILVICSGSNEILFSTGDADTPFGDIMSVVKNVRTRPFSVAAGSFNRDMFLDIVVPSYDANCISIYLGDKIFEDAYVASYSTGSGPHPYSIVTNDFNNDSILDILIVNSGQDNVDIQLGRGDGTFGEGTLYTTVFGSNPLFASTGNFQNSSEMAIAIANNRNDSITVIFPDINGTSTSKEIHLTEPNSSPFFIAFGNFDNKYHLDLAVTNDGTDNIGVFLSFDYVTFLNSGKYSTGFFSSPGSLVFGDLNEDEVDDIAVINTFDGNIGIFFGYRNGTFSKMNKFPTGRGSKPLGIVLRDVNNDSMMDIVVANSGTDGILIVFGNVNTTFTVQNARLTLEYSEPSSVALGDFNNDSILDIVVTSITTGMVGFFAGYGNESFSAPTIILNDSLANPDSITTADVNNDSLLDILVINTGTGSIGIFSGHGDGTFSEQHLISLAVSSEVMLMVVRDISNDGFSDIVICIQSISSLWVLLGYGNGSFSAPMIYSTGTSSLPTGVAIEDLNNDNKMDIVVTNYGTNNIGIFFGFGHGLLSEQMIIPTGAGSQPSSVIIHDFNYDHRPDIAVTNFRAGNMMIFVQHGNQRFLSMSKFSTGNNSHPRCLVIADLNHDSNMDIIVSNYGTDNIGILFGYGNGSFTKQKTYSTGNGSQPSSVVVGDFNNDKLLDAAVANVGSNSIGVLLGNGHGNFSAVSSYSIGPYSGPISVAVNDFNWDGNLDVVVANTISKTVIVLYGDGQGSFGRSQSYQFIYGSQLYSVSVGDLNRDNWTDIIVPNYGTDTVEKMLQICSLN